MMDHLTMRQRALVVVLGLGALLGLSSALRGHHGGEHCPFGRARFAAPSAHYPGPYAAPYAAYAAPPPPAYPPWGHGWHDRPR
jgi:hypothetical protein